MTKSTAGMTRKTAPRALNFYPFGGGMSPTGGYGRNETGIVRGLTEIGVDVQLVRPDDLSPRAAPLLITGNPAAGEDFPDSMPKFLYTMSETNRVSEHWVEAINRDYAAVFVPCPALVDIYRASGVSVPVIDAGHTLDQFVPPFQQRTWQPGQTFTFLTYSLGDLRKGAELALMALKRVFGHDPCYRMVVKGTDYESWLDGCEDAQVTVVGGKISEAEWQALLAKAHAFIFPSRGEGFGMPPREATLAGLPTAATRWLGMSDVDAWGFGIDVGGMNTCYFKTYEANAEGALWAEPDKSSLDAQLRRIVENYPAAVEKAAKGRAYLLAKHRSADVARAIWDVVKGIA